MIPNWLLKEYADILAFPITEILNALSVWKMPMSHPCRKETSSGSEERSKTYFSNALYEKKKANIQPSWPQALVCQ